MRTFGDFARLDFVQSVDPLSIRINGVHEMHAVRRSVSDPNEWSARGLTLIKTLATGWLPRSINWSRQDQNSYELEGKPE